MGRPETSIATPDLALRKLAEWLRKQRKDARITYAEMAERTVFSVATLSRATTGERIPKLPVAEAYARACGASAKEARRLWRAARYSEYRQTHPRSNAVPLHLVREPADMVTALQHLYYRAGAMPIDEMERRAGDHGELPHTTLLRMVHGKTMLSRRQLAAFLKVCEVPPTEHAQWTRAWMRAWRHRELDRGRDDSDYAAVEHQQGFRLRAESWRSEFTDVQVVLHRPPATEKASVPKGGLQAS
ncbi:helix-turn-helix domain-containing protein [Streptomyces sp. NEAU-Y11]|uniref:helix-turn-helix domain-containing protein n=1 Tax=Streptomyces cucumeris TaxID=2962890 RepID=UPI0020C86102|nr:helix-turn-helix transcriptional regulator [Streptomyces sp. NEAU-Y11]MCP9213383.1 helix-turn-helix domain-containing protein [Streptomyces sp. NEAU-Y11]